MVLKNKLLLIILIVVLALAAYFIYIKATSESVSKNSKDIFFSISKNEETEDIANNLENAGLINSSFWFKAYIKNKDLDKKIQAGEYLLSPSLSIKEIAAMLSGGQTINKEKTIKIIEGWRIDDISRYLVENKIVNGDEFIILAKTKTAGWNYDFFSGAPGYADLEGYLFPDTYRIFNDANANDIIIKMLNNLDNKLTSEMRADIKKSGKSIYEIITLASIIEKEVRSYEDMRIVSGIFLNRIKNGQPLESCATLAYIIGENKKQYTTEDTKIDSPYNTYQNRGLPPGPICSPGLNAIKAAIYPQKTEYNYFLSRFDNGETVFSKSYQEHLNNKAKYLK